MPWPVLRGTNHPVVTGSHRSSLRAQRAANLSVANCKMFYWLWRFHSSSRRSRHLFGMVNKGSDAFLITQPSLQFTACLSQRLLGPEITQRASLPHTCSHNPIREKCPASPNCHPEGCRHLPGPSIPHPGSTPGPDRLQGCWVVRLPRRSSLRPGRLSRAEGPKYRGS